MLLLIPLMLVMLDCLLGAPTGREVYRMPQSALKGIFKHFHFQFGLFSHLVVVATRGFSSNYSFHADGDRVCLQRCVVTSSR